MKHVIIGTAGHIDHGKTALVKALTGIETDRLAEEKRRGITIEPGFAHLDWPDGTQTDIIDVPGHERFIKNMLAGAGGIDLAMLVVAADDGFMPQTVEHLDILTMLGVCDGLTVITKTDLVAPDWLRLVIEEAALQTKGSFLEGKPILCVSARTGEGLPALREALRELVARAPEKNVHAAFRLPVDRVFSVDGFGTVVTGSLIEGTIHTGDTVELAPAGIEARVRSLQVHGRDVEAAYAGQRTAVNLAGIKKALVRRGDTVVSPGSVRASRMLDVHLRCLGSSRRTILNNSQLHLYHGASVLLAKVVLLDRDALSPGESCYAQLRLREPVSIKPGDRFVIRFYSPLETIGGGLILDDAPMRHKRGDSTVLAALRIRESGSDAERILQQLAAFGCALPGAEQLAQPLGMDAALLLPQLGQLAAAGRILEPLPGRYLSSAVFDGLWETCRALLAAYHARNPLHTGMRDAELRQKLFRSSAQSVCDAILAALCREGRIRISAGRCALADFSVRYTRRQAAIREELLALYRQAGVEPPATDEALARFAPNERNDARQVLESAAANGELLLLSPGLYCHQDAWRSACAVVRSCLAAHGTITLAELRDALGTSRKYALAILEYCDRSRITRREGDLRYPGALAGQL